MKSTIKCFLSLIVAVVCSVCAYAQVTTSTISGKITDKDGAVIGVPVIATHTPSGTTYYAVSDKNGAYRINNITPGGPYTVTVEMLGYRTVQYTGLYAELAQTMVIDTELQEESLSLDAAVFVADGKNSNMNVSRSGVGTTISNSVMANVPSVSRSLNDVMKLTPQASTTSNGFAVGGGNYRGSSVTVDGAAFNNAFGIGSNLPAGGSPISLDALEQMSINITPFDVRQSGFTGGAINAVTKAGTNEFHASVYNYYSSNALRGDFVAGNAISNTKSLDNTTGFTVGGPIIKNKLFFFVNAEYTQDTVPGSSYTTSKDGSIGATTNRPTAARLDDIKSFLSSQFKYNPGRYEGYDLSTPDYKILARLDWNINANHRLNVRFSNTHNYYSSQPSSSMSPVGGTNTTFTATDGNSYTFNRNSQGRQSQYALYYESARYFQEQNFLSAAAELNSRLLDGKINNKLRFTWSHQFEPRSYVGDLFPTVDILEPYYDDSGNKQYAMYTTFGVDPFTYGNLRDVTTYIATDEITYSTGIHNLIGGIQYEWNRAKNGFMQGGAGWYIYESWDAFVNDVKNPASSAGPNLFMITHANLDDATEQAFPTFDYGQLSVYAQDEMNISNNFKLTAGLRIEQPTMSFPYNNYNKAFAEIAKANPNSSLAGLSTDNVMSNKLAFSPRIGFNWDVLKDRSVVVRGGTGIYTGRIPFVWLVSAIGNSNVMQYQYINKNALNSGLHFSSDRSEIINNVWKANGGWKGAQDLAAPTATTIIDKDLKMPSTWKSSVAVDVKLPGGVKGTFEGVYSYGFNEVYAKTLNYKKNGTVQLPGEPEARDLWVSEGLKAGGYYAINTNLHGQYYALTAQLSKDWSFGDDLLSVTGAYTRSNSTAVSDGNGDQISEFANIYTKNGVNTPELGYANYVSPNRLIASVSYTLKDSRTASTFSLFYEGYNIGYIANYSYSRVSYLMNNVSGAGSASQLLFIPTAAQLKSMPFAKEENKAAYEEFISNDKYLSSHRGEYALRNGSTAPWINRINFHFGQQYFLNVAGKVNTLEFGVDVNNIANLINDKWGVYKQLSSNTVLNYKNGVYTFTAPKWNNYNTAASTWSAMISVRYSF